MADIFDTIFHHDQAVDTAAKGEAGVDARVDIGSFEYIRVNHAAAQELYPALMATNATTFLAAERAAESEFETWLSEWEIVRVDADIELLTVIFLQKLL